MIKQERLKLFILGVLKVLFFRAPGGRPAGPGASNAPGTGFPGLLPAVSAGAPVDVRALPAENPPAWWLWIDAGSRAGAGMECWPGSD